MSRSDSRNPGISRRDFLNGVLLAAGGAAVGASFPARALGAPSFVCDGGAGTDPRVLRGGNLPEAFNVAHWLRDRRLTFSSSRLMLAPSNCDANHGTFDILEDNGQYDVIIVGAGMSGLAAAFYLRRRRRGTRILILDGQEFLGGNAGRDDERPIGNIATTGAAYAVAPYAPFLDEIYTATGVNWEKHVVEAPFYCYWFDDRTPFRNPGARGWNLDSYGAGMDTLAYSPDILRDLKASRDDFLNWYDTAGGPTDPADNGDPQFDQLSTISLSDYLTGTKGYHSAVPDFYTRYTVDALSSTADQVNAYSAISFLGADFNPIFAFPGGNSGIARHIARWLVPSAFPKNEHELIKKENDKIRGQELDDRHNQVRIRMKSTVLRGDTTPSTASVVYFNGGRFYRATAKAVIFAGQGHTAATCLAHLMSARQIGAFFRGMTLAPVVVANVTLRHARSLVDQGLGYNQYWWGSQYWADFTIADWMDRKRRDDRHRRVTLSVFGGNEKPASEMSNERLNLLNTPFFAYEASLRDDLNRVLATGGFDFDRDVESVFLYRWGHSQVLPVPGYPFGPVQANGQVDRSQAARRIFRQSIGRISIGAQDTEGSPAAESAIGAGLRTALEVLPRL